METLTLHFDRNLSYQLVYAITAAHDLNLKKMHVPRFLVSIRWENVGTKVVKDLHQAQGAFENAATSHPCIQIQYVYNNLVVSVFGQYFIVVQTCMIPL